jgi:hypothetical protein
MTVVETPFFVRKAGALLDEEERSELIVFLGMNPRLATWSLRPAESARCVGPHRVKASGAESA